VGGALMLSTAIPAARARPQTTAIRTERTATASLRSAQFLA
jgi:hypothetical protein